MNNQLMQRKIDKIFTQLLGKIKGVVYTPEASPLVREDTFTDAECLMRSRKEGVTLHWR